jgi:hypothetical protein
LVLQNHSARSASNDCQPVLVSKLEIPTGTELDPLIAEGDFQTICVPLDQEVDDAVRSTSEVAGRTTAATIYANEQIPVTRLLGAFRRDRVKGFRTSGILTP